jgi:hypothetical protein
MLPQPRPEREVSQRQLCRPRNLEDGDGISKQSSTLLQACGPREPHPRQVDILLDNGMPALPGL